MGVQIYNNAMSNTEQNTCEPTRNQNEKTPSETSEEEDASCPAMKALPNMSECTHLAGNPVFNPIYTKVTYDDPRSREQGSWYKSEPMLYKTSSGEYGKYTPLTTCQLHILDRTPSFPKLKL